MWRGFLSARLIVGTEGTKGQGTSSESTQRITPARCCRCLRSQSRASEPRVYRGGTGASARLSRARAGTPPTLCPRRRMAHESVHKPRHSELLCGPNGQKGAHFPWKERTRKSAIRNYSRVEWIRQPQKKSMKRLREIDNSDYKYR